MNLDTLYQALIADLTAPRPITDPVQEILANQYGFAPEAFAQFVTEKLPTLEAYEVDLAFSPLFTPTFADTARYAALLAEGHLDAASVLQLKNQLAEANLSACLVPPTGEKTPCPLQEVMIDRFVDRLYLERPLSFEIFTQIKTLQPASSQGAINALSRYPVWQAPWRQEMLKGFLAVLQTEQGFALERFEYLTEFLYSYRPTGLEDLVQKLGRVIESCKTDLEGLPGRTFHDHQLKVSYADNTASQVTAKEEANRVKSFYERLIALATELINDYETLMRQHPEVIQKVNSLSTTV